MVMTIRYIAKCYLSRIFGRIAMAMQKDVVLGFLEGHRRANEVIRAERKKRLSQLTVEDSLREYDALCKIWEANPNKEGLGLLEKQKISFLLERRKRFNKVSGLK